MHHAQVDEVLDVMKDNVNKVMERDGKLNELDARANILNETSGQFAMNSRKLRKKMWWENMKMKMIIGGVVVVLLIIIIVIIVVETGGSDSGNDSDATTKKPN